MAKLASPKAKPKAAPKTIAKPGKAGKALAKPKAEPKAKQKVGDEVLFNGYSKENENPIFEAGDRLTVVSVKTDEEKNIILGAVKSEDYEAYQADADSVTGDEVYASEVEKAPKEPANPYALALKEDAVLDDFIAEQGDGDPLTAATNAAEAIATNTFLLGGCLTKLYADQTFRTYDPEAYADDRKDDKAIPNSGWDKFTQANFEMNGRKGLSLIAIYRSFNRLGDKVDLAEIAADKKIGWVKLGAMAQHVTEDNVESLIEQARALPVEDFRSMIRTDYVSGSGEATSAGPKVKRITIKAVLYEDAANAVQAVIDMVAKQLGTEDVGTIIEYIVSDWAHNSLDEKQIAKVTSARTTTLKTLKKSGVDVTDRQKAFDELTSLIEGGGDDEAGEAEEAEAEAA